MCAFSFSVMADDACDPFSTDALGMSFDTDYDGRILVAGSRGGNYYMALKDPEVQ